MGLLQLSAGATAEHGNLDVGVAAVLAFKGEPLPHSLPTTASGELLDSVRAGPAVENHKEVPHVHRLAHQVNAPTGERA